MIFSAESTFYVLKRKNQCKIWHLEKEKLLPECIQQTNTGDGGKVGIWVLFLVLVSRLLKFIWKIWMGNCAVMCCNIN